MTAQNVSQKKPSAKASALSARLSAVQALYQHIHNKKPINTLIDEYIHERAGMEIDGEALVEPDGALVKKIINGVNERFSELEAVIQANTKKTKITGDEEGRENKSIEPLLQAILLAGSYELLAHQDIDSPIIINDYLNVTHAFYDKAEAGLVNGVLDTISKLFRESLASDGSS